MQRLSTFVADVLAVLSGAAGSTTAAVADLNVAGAGALAGAWTSTAAIVTAQSGTITSASSSVRYKKLGRIVFCNVLVSIPNNGSGSGAVLVAMPFANSNAGNTVLTGRENANTGKMVAGLMGPSSNSLTINFYDNTYPGANGVTFTLSGIYEALS